VVFVLQAEACSTDTTPRKKISVHSSFFFFGGGGVERDKMRFLNTYQKIDANVFFKSAKTYFVQYVNSTE